MHFFLCDFLPHPWELFAGENDKLGGEEPWAIPKAVCHAIGGEIKAGRRTVPLSQARSLRDITKHSGSYETVDWLYFLLSVGDVVLADRIPKYFFKMFMQLCHSGRLIFKSGCMMEVELRQVDKLI